MKRVTRSIFLVLMVMLLFQNRTWATNQILETNTKIEEEQEVNQELEIETKYDLRKVEEQNEEAHATILSFGDTLCHMPLVNAAYDTTVGEYEFSYMFKYVDKYFKDATICIGNCEVPMAGASIGYSGYPQFNAPEHLAVDLQELGVDIMTTANNHTLDKGFSGLASTLEVLDNAQISHVGTARNQEEQDSILFKDLNGIKTVFLSYTYGTNGIPVPKGKEFSVNLIDKNLMLKQINKAKQEGAELIVVSIHWGVEYKTVENSNQRELAEFLIANDVQVILGSHPHVLQPMRRMQVQTANGEIKEGVVIFSQGNFFSNQTRENTRNTALFNIEVKKNKSTNVVTVEKAMYMPIYVNRKEPGAKDRYELLDLNEIIRSYEAGEETWSKELYDLAVREKAKCISLIGPEI